MLSLLACVLLGAAPLPDDVLAIAPDVLEVPAERPFADLMVSNPGSVPRAVQLEALSWTQDEAGRVLVSPSDDASMFPARATILPGQTRRFRFSTPEPEANRERAFRISVAVLDASSRVTVNALVPAFVAPARPLRAATLTLDCERPRRCRLVIANTGTVRMRPAAISVAAAGEGGGARRDLDPWWVLAGDVRVYEVPLEGAGWDQEVVARVAVDGRELVTQAPREPAPGRDPCARR